jgi:hypothetical protein
MTKDNPILTPATLVTIDISKWLLDHTERF